MLVQACNVLLSVTQPKFKQRFHGGWARLKYRAPNRAGLSHLFCQSPIVFVRKIY